MKKQIDIKGLLKGQKVEAEFEDGEKFYFKLPYGTLLFCIVGAGIFYLLSFVRDATLVINMYEFFAAFSLWKVAEIIYAFYTQIWTKIK